MWIRNKILSWLGITPEFLHIQLKINELDKDILATINKQLDFQEQMTEEVRRCMEELYMRNENAVLQLTAGHEKKAN
jgi:hypothetical protein